MLLGMQEMGTLLERWCLDGAEVRRRLRRGVRLPGSVVPADVIATKVKQAEDDAVADFGTLSRCFAQVIWWAFHLSPALR